MKGAHWLGGGAGLTPFPPRSCGGLIEGRWLFELARRGRRAFPPRSCGGLIEGQAVDVALKRAPALSPRVRAGASLKEPLGGGAETRQRPFPPRSCGGLIEGAKPVSVANRETDLSPRVRAGASLKVIGLSPVCEGLHLSPRVRAGASLKVDCERQGADGGPPFPPRSCGGLIEGRTAHRRRNARMRFPPAFVRGPH